MAYLSLTLHLLSLTMGYHNFLKNSQTKLFKFSQDHALLYEEITHNKRKQLFFSSVTLKPPRHSCALLKSDVKWGRRAEGEKERP